jgi:hypothetical protein
MRWALDCFLITKTKEIISCSNVYKLWVTLCTIINCKAFTVTILLPKGGSTQCLVHSPFQPHCPAT